MAGGLTTFLTVCCQCNGNWGRRAGESPKQMGCYKNGQHHRCSDDYKDYPKCDDLCPVTEDISHGICKACYAVAIAKLEKRKLEEANKLAAGSSHLLGCS